MVKEEGRQVLRSGAGANLGISGPLSLHPGHVL